MEHAILHALIAGSECDYATNFWPGIYRLSVAKRLPPIQNPDELMNLDTHAFKWYLARPTKEPILTNIDNPVRLLRCSNVTWSNTLFSNITGSKVLLTIGQRRPPPS